MKAVVVFALLFAVVFCKPVKRSSSSSESSEEQAAMQADLKTGFVPTEETFVTHDDYFAITGDDSDDLDDDDDDDDHVDESDQDSDDSDESDESDETTTILPMSTLLPSTEPGRGDNMGYFSDYKKKLIDDDKANYIEKEPSGYKFAYINAKDVNAPDFKAVLDPGMGAFSGTEGDEQVELKAESTSSPTDSSPDISQDSSQESNESSQEGNESNQESNESNQESNESNQESNESNHEGNESSQESNESSQESSEETSTPATAKSSSQNEELLQAVLVK